MSVTTTAYSMFAQQFLFNVINLAHVNDGPVDAAKPQALVDRLVKRMKSFEPARTAIVRQPIDNAGLCQLGSASTAALFPSRKSLVKAANNGTAAPVTANARVAAHSLQV